MCAAVCRASPRGQAEDCDPHAGPAVYASLLARAACVFGRCHALSRIEQLFDPPDPFFHGPSHFSPDRSSPGSRFTVTAQICGERSIIAPVNAHGFPARRMEVQATVRKRADAEVDLKG
jgi:hypothetical protein